MVNNGIYDSIARNVDHYARIENELQTLNEDELQELLLYEPYVTSNNALMMVVNGELMKLVRMQVNQRYEVIDSVVRAIQDFKKNKNKEVKDFQDYIKNYSHLTYKEYLELRNENGRVKE